MTTPGTFIKLRNPYTFGVPVRGEGKFFGREEELRLIFDTLEDVPYGQKQDLVVLGPRRIGKSSLLYRLVDLLSERDDFIPVYIDLQNIKPRRIRLLFTKMLKDIAKQYHPEHTSSEWLHFDILEKTSIPADLEFLTCNDDMVRLNEAIASRKLPRLVLMFDEVELLVDFGGADTLDWLRSLIQSLSYVIFVVAGSDRLYSLTQDYGSPFYNIFKTIELYPLTLDAARRLIEEPARDIGLGIAHAEVETILRYAGKNPYFIQAIAHYLVAEVNQQQRYQVYSEDVKKVVRASVKFLSSQLAYFWNSVTQTQRVMLYALAKGRSPRTADDMLAHTSQFGTHTLSAQEQQALLDDLVRNQILITQDGQYWFAVLLFANWISSEVNEEELVRSVATEGVGQAQIIYNREPIRHMLHSAFDDAELRDFILDTFPVVYAEISLHMPKDTIIDRLIRYTESENQFDRLLAEIEMLKPDYYDRFIKDAVSVRVHDHTGTKDIPSLITKPRPSESELRIRLRDILMRYFTVSELHDLSFDLGIDYENVPGIAKSDKARELVLYADRHNRIAELADYIAKYRPHVSVEPK